MWAVGLYFFVGLLVACAILLQGQSVADALVGLFLWPLLIAFT